MFFDKLVKAPIKILVYGDSAEFLRVSRMVQAPIERQFEGSPNVGKYYVFDDDGRWLQISGSVICAWRKPKDINDGNFLFGYGFELKVSTINCEASSYSDSQEGIYKTRGMSGYFSSLKDFVRTMAIVCADNANLCPVIDRYFSSTRRRASLSGNYV